MKIACKTLVFVGSLLVLLSADFVDQNSPQLALVREAEALIVRRAARVAVATTAVVATTSAASAFSASAASASAAAASAAHASAPPPPPPPPSPTTVIVVAGPPFGQRPGGLGCPDRNGRTGVTPRLCFGGCQWG